MAKERILIVDDENPGEGPQVQPGEGRFSGNRGLRRGGGAAKYLVIPRIWLSST